MKAVVLPGYNKPLELTEIEKPKAGPGEVVVKIAAAGLCHSDLHLSAGEISVPSFPWVLGHENTGWIDQLGEGVTGLSVGDLVAVFGAWGCGVCRTCRQGNEQLCANSSAAGISAPGGFAEYILVPHARHLLTLNGLDPISSAPLVDAALTPYRAVQAASHYLYPGSTSVVIGCGGLGQYGVQLASLLSQSKIIAVDTSREKREAAATLGASATCTPSGLGAELARISDEGKAAVVFDYVGSSETLDLAAKNVALQGAISVIGLAGGHLDYSFFGLPFEVRIWGSAWGNHLELMELIDLAQDKRLRTNVETFSFDDANLAMQRLRDGKIAGRAVLVPS